MKILLIFTAITMFFQVQHLMQSVIKIIALKEQKICADEFEKYLELGDFDKCEAPRIDQQSNHNPALCLIFKKASKCNFQ